MASEQRAPAVPEMPAALVPQLRDLPYSFCVRSLRRRLWKAFASENADLALRLYRLDRQGFVRLLEEEIEAEWQHHVLVVKQKQLAQQSRDSTHPKNRRRHRLRHGHSRTTEHSLAGRVKQVKATDTASSIDCDSIRASFVSRVVSCIPSKQLHSEPTAQLHASASSSVAHAKDNPVHPETPSADSASTLLQPKNEWSDLPNRQSILEFAFSPSDPFGTDDFRSPYDPYDEPKPHSDNDTHRQNDATEHRGHSRHGRNDSERVRRRHRRRQQHRSTADTPRTAFRAWWGKGRTDRHSLTSYDAGATSGMEQPGSAAGRSMQHATGDLESDAVREKNSDDGDNVASNDVYWTTPLHEAARLGSSQLVRIFLAKSRDEADPNIKNGRGRTALHMACGGLTKLELALQEYARPKDGAAIPDNDKRASAKGSSQEGKNLYHQRVVRKPANVGIGIPDTPPPAVDCSDDPTKDKHSGSVGMKAAKVMGRMIKSIRKASKSKHLSSSNESAVLDQSDLPPDPLELRFSPASYDASKSLEQSIGSSGEIMKMLNEQRANRMETVAEILSWSPKHAGVATSGPVHDAAGLALPSQYNGCFGQQDAFGIENGPPSINAVDSKGRTALHYAAETGREDLCLALLSSTFGVLLTVVDDVGARTPCELAALHGHQELAAQLEARAVLYTDPYGMEEEYGGYGADEEYGYDESGNYVVYDPYQGRITQSPAEILARKRKKLVPPFNWFATLDMDQVHAERQKRLEKARKHIFNHVQKWHGQYLARQKAREDALAKEAMRNRSRRDPEPTNVHRQSVPGMSDSKAPSRLPKSIARIAGTTPFAVGIPEEQLNASAKSDVGSDVSSDVERELQHSVEGGRDKLEDEECGLNRKPAAMPKSVPPAAIVQHCCHMDESNSTSAAQTDLNAMPRLESVNRHTEDGSTVGRMDAAAIVQSQDTSALIPATAATTTPDDTVDRCPSLEGAGQICPKRGEGSEDDGDSERGEDDTEVERGDQVDARSSSTELSRRGSKLENGFSDDAHVVEELSLTLAIPAIEGMSALSAPGEKNDDDVIPAKADLLKSGGDVPESTEPNCKESRAGHRHSSFEATMPALEDALEANVSEEACTPTCSAGDDHHRAIPSNSASGTGKIAIGLLVDDDEHKSYHADHSIDFMDGRVSAMERESNHGRGMDDVEPANPGAESEQTDAVVGQHDAHVKNALYQEPEGTAVFRSKDSVGSADVDGSGSTKNPSDHQETCDAVQDTLNQTSGDDQPKSETLRSVLSTDRGVASASPTKTAKIDQSVVRQSSNEPMESACGTLPKATYDDAPEPIKMLDKLQNAHVEQLLAHYKWKNDSLRDAFKRDMFDAFTNAGISLPTIEPSSSKLTSSGNATCMICYDDELGVDDWMELQGCVHGFCRPCLQEYLTDCAAAKMTGMCVPCPHHECKSYLTTEEITSLLESNLDSHSRIIEASNENFVASAFDLRFCPYPGCTEVVRRLHQSMFNSLGRDMDLLDCLGAVCTAGSNFANGLTTLSYDGVIDPEYNNCRCLEAPAASHRFCFSCGEGVHWPIPCARLEKWRTKIREELGDVDSPGGDMPDVAQRLWLKANTRPCPKCNVPIEKNDGCNHMTCSNPSCNHEFCWICRKDWKLHGTSTGGFFRCNIWADGDGDADLQGDSHDDDLHRPARANEHGFINGDNNDQGYGTAIHSARAAYRKKREMDRFLHHYTRWNAHSESAALERKMAETAAVRLAPVVEAAVEFDGNAHFNFGGKGLSFVHAAFTELLECRSVLQHSYPFSYFRYPSFIVIRRYGQLSQIRREKATFEKLQSELETMTEQMSDIVARSHLRASQFQITFLTKGAAEKRQELSNLMLSILVEERKEEGAEWSMLSAADLVRAAARARDRMTTSSSPHASIVSRMVDDVWPGSDGMRLPDYGGRTVSRSQFDPFTLTADRPGEATLDPSMNDFARDEQTQMWSCGACTYMNSDGGRRCAMCGTIRDRH